MRLEVIPMDDGYHLRKWEEAQDPDGVWTEVPPGSKPTSVYVREARLTLRPDRIEYGPALKNPYTIYRW